MDDHVPRVKGSRAFGYDASNERIMISADGGRRWHERRPPPALVDMVIDPKDPAVLVASTEAGLMRAADRAAPGGDLAAERARSGRGNSYGTILIRTR